MGESWGIEYYETVRGDKPVQDFIDSLEAEARTKVRATLRLLREFGLQIGGSYVKKVVGTELWELRILGEQSVRIFYVARSGRMFLLLLGFLKKQQDTPRQEIKTALARLREWDLRT